MRSFVLFMLLALFTLSLSAKTKFVTYNIRNFDYDERSHIPTDKSALRKLIREVAPDFMGVAEINQTEVFDDFMKSGFSKRYKTALTNCGGAHDQHLGFVYDSNKFTLKNFQTDLRTSNPFNQRYPLCHDGSRPLAIGHFKIKSSRKEFIAINVHFKSGSRHSSLSKRYKQVELLGDVIKEYRVKGFKNFIVTGDFNTTEYLKQGHYYDQFRRKISAMGLVNVTGNRLCSAYWWGGRDDGKQYPSLLDHILISKDFLGNHDYDTEAYAHCKKVSCQVASEHRLGTNFTDVSDHCPLAVTF